MVDRVPGGPWRDIASDELTLRQSNELAQAFRAKHTPAFVYLDGCYCGLSNPYQEVLLLTVDVEIPQKVDVDIQPSESIAVVFSQGYDVSPKVFMLRDSFPKYLSHLNLVPPGYPCSLCLTNESHYESSLKWTASSFLKSIRHWLKQTATGSLHQQDQTLEPFIAPSSDTIILPTNVNELAGKTLYVYRLYDGQQKTAIAKLSPDRKEDKPSVALVFKADPRTHGVISNRPSSLFDLNQLLISAGIDLIEELVSWFSDWKNVKRHLNSNLVLIVILPKKRHIEGNVESEDIVIFTSIDAAGDIGCKLGMLGKFKGVYSPLAGASLSTDGSDILVAMLNRAGEITRDVAAYCNAAEPFIPIKLVAVGAGALGAQVINNLVRSGVGNWTIIDKDILLPHNMARHLLTGLYAGHPKSETLSFQLNTIFPEHIIENSIVADVLDLNEKQMALLSDLSNNDILLDMSASVAVARFLSVDVESPARRLSLFMNPTGSDLVLLAEDNTRSLSLDCLEILYYREIVRTTSLVDHLTQPEDEIRYGNSCRDISMRISQSMFAIHGGIGSASVRRAIDSNEAIGTIWCTDSRHQVNRHEIALTGFTQHKSNDWTVKIALDLIQNIKDQRNKLLPKETGGVLIGSYDMQRRILYIVDSIPAPPDSKFLPSGFIRGCVGLAEEVQMIAERSSGWLKYVGEWHSHPGTSTKPSLDDKELFAWLKGMFDQEGLPSLMLIAAQTRYRLYINEL